VTQTSRTIGSFDGIAEGYDFIGSMDPNRGEFFLSNLSESRMSALDVGCGSGILASKLAEHYEGVVGIDISEDMLAIARSKRALANVEYRWMDANEIAFDEQFDLIVSNTTFHHLRDVGKTLETLKGLLRPGGRIVVVDCVLRRFVRLNAFARRHPWMFALMAIAEAPSWARRVGAANAVRALRFQLSRPWREHLASDHFLKPDEFERVYGAALPGAGFESPRSGFMSARWDKPSR
jgi:ubiquinone/menaquinone biosynthesis C-methylase UbiE